MVLEMKRCSECRVEVNETANNCPLCYGKINKIDENVEVNSYPKIELSLKKYRNLFKIFGLISLFICIFSLVVNYITESNVKWSLILTAGIAYWWTTIGFSINSSMSKTYRIIIETILLDLLVIILDLVQGYTGISINYVIPIITITVNLIVLSIIIINKTKWKKYVMYQLTLLIIGLLPLICIPFGLIYNYLPLTISIITTGMMFISTVVYKRRDLKDEYIRRFHI